MSSPEVLPARHRRYTALGVAVSVAAPPAAPEPTIQRLVQVLGVPGSARPLVAESRWHYLVRFGLHIIGSFVLLLALSLALLAVAPTVFGYRPVVVASGSMAPALRAADVVVVRPPPEELGVGAVIDYRVGDTSRIHRIVEITEAGYRTQGDANPTPDPQLVVAEDIEGVGVMVVPYVGALRLWFDEGRWAQLLALTVVLTAAGWVTPRRWLHRADAAGRALLVRS